MDQVDRSVLAPPGWRLRGTMDADITLTGAAGFAQTADAAVTTANVANLDVSTVTGAQKALSLVDNALSSINNTRADLGAIQNRFTSVVANLQTSTENLSASRSRIKDTDFAKETAERIDGRVQHAGLSALALGQRESWQALRRCSVALLADKNLRALLLPQVRTLTTRRTEPLILLAYRETGNARNRESMLARNRLRHPGFIMPGQTLEWTDA